MTHSILAKLLERAADNTAEGITISDMSAPDRPLIYANQGFEDLTGYDRNEVIGKNCRFLQGKDTDPASVQSIRDAITDGRENVTELLNYRKDGTHFWNRLSISPIRDEQGKVAYYVGIQSDITELTETRERLERANMDLERFYERVSRDLEQARAVQKFLLPVEFPFSNKIRFASLFDPLDEIGGDFYDVIEIGDQAYGALIADVTGHGIPAALLTFTSSTTFKSIAPKLLSAAAVLNLTNQSLYKRLPDDSFVTMFYAIYHAGNQQLNYVQAGHPCGILLRPSTQEIIKLETAGTLVGVFSSDEVQFSQGAIAMMPRDRVILHTDALTDAFEMKDDSALEEFLDKTWELSLDQLVEAIYEQGLTLSDQVSYPDDFTLLSFEILGDD